MSSKALLIFCAQALLVQSALSQCTSCAAVAATPGIAAPTLAAPYGLGAPCGMASRYSLDAPFGLEAPYGLTAPCGIAAPIMDFTSTSGGLLPISSASAIAPVGISVASENVYEGPLAVTAELPFVGTVGLEGVLPTAGVGAVNRACGNGVNAMISENAAFTPGYAGAAIAPAAAISPFGAIAPGIAAPGLGYRARWADRGCGCAL